MIVLLKENIGRECSVNHPVYIYVRGLSTITREYDTYTPNKEKRHVFLNKNVTVTKNALSWVKQL